MMGTARADRNTLWALAFLASAVFLFAPPALAGAEEWAGGPADGWEEADANTEGAVHFDSTPKGASVLVEGVVLCESTPCWRKPPALTAWTQTEDGEYQEVVKGDGDLQSHHAVGSASGTLE